MGPNTPKTCYGDAYLKKWTLSLKGLLVCQRQACGPQIDTGLSALQLHAPPPLPQAGHGVSSGGLGGGSLIGNVCYGDLLCLVIIFCY